MNNHGFTMVEALVAMAVLAVASTGLIRATQAHVDLVAGVRDRSVARWVAQNRLAELRLGLATPASVVMYGRRWQVSTRRVPTATPGLEAIDVAVAAPGGAPLAVLESFRETGGSR